MNCCFIYLVFSPYRPELLSSVTLSLKWVSPCVFLSNFHMHSVDQFAQVDVSGHAWMAGYTKSSLDGHSNAGGQDKCIMKFDDEGVHQWTHQRGGEGDDIALALQADGVRHPSF